MTKLEYRILHRSTKAKGRFQKALQFNDKQRQKYWKGQVVAYKNVMRIIQEELPTLVIYGD